jgi:hypothetical protein
MFSSAQQDASQLRSLIKANATRIYFLTIYIERLPSYQVTEPIPSYFRSERERLEMVHKLLARIPEVSLSIVILFHWLPTLNVPLKLNAAATGNP